MEVDDDHVEVEGHPATRNDRTEARVGDTWHFKNGGEDEHIAMIHHPPDPADETLIDEALAPDDEVDLTFDEPSADHVWCRSRGEMTSGMAVAVEAKD